MSKRACRGERDHHGTTLQGVEFVTLLCPARQPKEAKVSNMIVKEGCVSSGGTESIQDHSCLCTWLCAHVGASVHTCVHECVHMCAAVFTYMCAWWCVCTRLCAYVGVCVCMHAGVCAPVCLAVCVPMCTCLCTCVGACVYMCGSICVCAWLCMYPVLTPGLGDKPGRLCLVGRASRLKVAD